VEGAGASTTGLEAEGVDEPELGWGWEGEEAVGDELPPPLPPPLLVKPPPE